MVAARTGCRGAYVARSCDSNNMIRKAHKKHVLPIRGVVCTPPLLVENKPLDNAAIYPVVDAVVRTMYCCTMQYYGGFCCWEATPLKIAPLSSLPAARASRVPTPTAQHHGAAERAKMTTMEFATTFRSSSPGRSFTNTTTTHSTQPRIFCLPFRIPCSYLKDRIHLIVEW